MVSGSKRYPVSQSIPISNRSIGSTNNSASSPVFNSVEHIRSYSLSRTHSDQSSPLSTSNLPMSTTTRRTSMSDVKEKPRRGF